MSSRPNQPGVGLGGREWPECARGPHCDSPKGQELNQLWPWKGNVVLYSGAQTALSNYQWFLPYQAYYWLGSVIVDLAHCPDASLSFAHLACEALLVALLLAHLDSQLCLSASLFPFSLSACHCTALKVNCAE
jgi:hypothetical protein